MIRSHAELGRSPILRVSGSFLDPCKSIGSNLAKISAAADNGSGTAVGLRSGEPTNIGLGIAAPNTDQGLDQEAHA